MILNPLNLPPPVGWPLLPMPNAAGELEFPSLAESVRQNLRVILSTRPGEQLMRPGYGAGLVEFLHAPNTVTTRRQIHDRVTEGIRQWEGRIDVDRIDVAPVEDQPGMVRIEVNYRLRRTGEALTLGAQLELEPTT
ncbi:MAG TPA: GPW/gp25 family protein [Verrucomicrobiota bacterium]|nr:GPW/gp25 family protein [Verrucomicrobiota bacterium]